MCYAQRGCFGVKGYKRSKPFYHSAAWKQARTAVLQRDHYLCVCCLRKGKITPARTVHHIEHYANAPDKALDLDNLISLCDACHNQMHPERQAHKSDRQPPPNVRIIKI